MTSSLVGSEMCIRDSVRLHGVLPLRVVGQRQELGGRQRAGDECDGGAAVSYTHLTLPTICSV
eukprot:12705073-Prorocentrum_lima.AAC.1